MKLILVVVSAAIHRFVGLGADDDLFEISRSAGYLIELRTHFVIH